MKVDTLPSLHEHENSLMKGKLAIFLLRDFKAALICFAFGVPLFISTSWILQEFGIDSTVVVWLSTVIFALLAVYFYTYLLESDFLLPSSTLKFDQRMGKDILECSSDFSLKENDAEVYPTLDKLTDDLELSNFSSRDMALFHLKIGLEKIKVGLYEDAILEFDLALKQDDLNDSVYQCQGHALLLLQKYHEAVNAFSKAIELNQLSYLAFNKRGYAYARLGTLELAIKDFQSALLIKPDYKEASHNLDVAFGATSSGKRETNL